MDALEVFPKPIWFELTSNMDSLSVIRLRNASKSMSILIDEVMQNRWPSVRIRQTLATKDKEVRFNMIRITIHLTQNLDRNLENSFLLLTWQQAVLL